jgi:iron complex transport system substrate-binding protein
MFALIAVAALAASGAQWLGPKPKAEVKRVVTVAPSLTDTVVRLGAAATLVGVSRFDELPEVAKLPRVGGFSDPSVEAVLALKPDLLVVQKAPGNQAPIEKLASLGVPVVALPLTTIADVVDSIQVLGATLGRAAEAQALVKGIEAARAQVRARAKQRGTRPKVMLVYGWTPLVVAGPGSYAHEMMVDCGADNVAQPSTTAYPVMSLESVVKLKPDVIIDAADVMEGKEQIQSLKPLGKARWVKLETKELLQPGAGLGAGLKTLADLLEAPDAGR